MHFLTNPYTGVFFPGRHHPRLGEFAFSPGQGTSRLGENNSESTLASQKHSRFGEMLSFRRIMQKTTPIRQFMHYLLSQSYYTCLI